MGESTLKFVGYSSKETPLPYLVGRKIPKSGWSDGIEQIEEGRS